MDVPHAAIVGAGMAGLAAAQALREAGWRVALLERSRGIGGRMATRRDGAAVFDHGAQHVTGRHFGGPRVEGAVLSGFGAAQAVTRSAR